MGLQLAPLSMGEGGEGEEDGDRLRSTTVDDEESDMSLSSDVSGKMNRWVIFSYLRLLLLID